MKLLLKTLLIRSPKDRGYVIPVVFALGLIMTLIGTITIFQSGDEEIISISQRESSRALAAAEAGVARYREFINRYKVIAMYDACLDDDDDDEGDNWGGTDCSDPTSNVDVVTWSSTTIPNLDSYCPARDADGNSITVATAVDNMASRGWQNIVEGDAKQGQYRLIDYVYNPGTFDPATNRYNDGEQPTGILTVEGRVGQENTDLTNEAGAAVASIQVQLPVQPGLPNVDGNLSLAPFINGFNPALWIVGANDTNINLGDIRVNGNIVVTDADCDFEGNLPNNDDLFTTDDDKNNAIIVDPRSVPIVGDPFSVTPPPIPSAANVNLITLADLTTESLPINGATETMVKGDAVYYYKLVSASGTGTIGTGIIGTGTDLNLTGGDTINIRNGRKVVLFVEGNIDIDASGGNINVNPAVANDSSHLEIYATDNTSTVTFDGNGIINIKALLHAPASPVTIFNDPNVTFTGAMWVENFTGKNLTETFDINLNSAGTAIDEDQYLNYTYVYNDLVDLNIRIADPIISRPSQWNTQQVK